MKIYSQNYSQFKNMKKDRLEEIFELQRKFNRSIGIDTDNMSDARQQQWILNYCRALSQEVANLVDCCQWKWWARYQKFDKENAKMEIINILYFLISIAQVLGMSADDFYELCCKKNEVDDNRYTKKRSIGVQFIGKIIHNFFKNENH